jgi:molybdopterin-guanine dinucleotide biosynthesis protein A/uridine kinase
MPRLFAVVLAGGRSSRFDGDKLAAETGDGALLDVTLRGLPAHVAVVVVGPVRPVRRPALFVREEPAGGGPAAALVAGVAAALGDGADRVVVLPGDAPGAGAAAAVLLAALADGARAAVGVDAAGLEQPLQVAMTREAAVDLVAAAGPDGAAHRSARTLLGALRARPVPLAAGLTWDVDTRPQLAGWRARDSEPVAAVLAVVDRVAPVAGAGGVAVVALDGHSGAGKSTLALAAASHCGAVVLEGDDFYSPRLAPLDAAARAALTPAALAAEVIDWRRLRAEALEPLLAGRVATYRAYDWEADDGRLGEPVRLRPAPVVLLDGVYSARPELSDLVAGEVLVEAPGRVRRQRLVERNEADPGWEPLWAAAEDHYFAAVRPPSSFAVRVRTA